MKSPTTPGLFVAFRNDRLGGRLNALLTAMRLARKYDAPFRMFWAVTEGSSPELQHPEELFSADFIARHFTSREEGARLVARAADIGMQGAGASETDFVRALAGGQVYLSSAATEQLLLPWESPEALEVLPDLLAGIDFHPDVARIMARIPERLAGLDFRAYHLRRGDIIDDATLASHNLWPDKYIPRVIYEWHMRRELARGDDTLVVFSDAPHEARAFAALSPRITSFDSLVGEAEVTQLQRDFLELYTMSRATQIFAPPSSAFSGIAAAIGNRRVTDITADLSSGDREAALDELVRRMEHAPGTFFSQSDRGQNLPFVQQHLEARGERGRVTEIAFAQLQAGMDRAYLAPFLSGRLLDEGRLDELDTLIDTLIGRPSYREEHLATVHAHGVIADLLRGNTDRAVTRFHLASWFAPLDRLVGECFWFMTSAGLLDAPRAFPYDPDLMRPSRWVLRSMPGSAARLDALYPGDRWQYPGNLEVRDWRVLQGKKLNFNFSNKAKVERQARTMAENFRRLSGARLTALQSAVGAMLAEAGVDGEAGELMRTAVAAQPDVAIYRKRLGAFLLARGKPRAGLAELVAADEASGGHPAYRATLALAHLNLRDQARYREMMLGLRDSDSPIVELRLLVIEALRRDKATLDAAQSEMAALAARLPATHRTIAVMAKLHEQLKNWDEALDALTELRRLGRPEAGIGARFAQLAKAHRAVHGEDATQDWLQRHGVAE